jgi:hypothetical protein
MTATSLAVLSLLTLLPVVAVEVILFRTLVRHALPWRPHGRPATVLHETDAQAAIAEAGRLLRAAQRPRCGRCRHLLDRDARSAFWHCTQAGCPVSRRAPDSAPL